MSNFATIFEDAILFGIIIRTTGRLTEIEQGNYSNK